MGYVHFPFLGDESYRAAEASECADDQDKFWEYHDLLFESQNGENQGAFTDENLIKLAQQLKLDTDKFTECLTSNKYKELVQSEGDFGRQIGVQSTPTFLVNTIPVLGAQSFESFQSAIESELSKTR